MVHKKVFLSFLVVSQIPVCLQIVTQSLPEIGTTEQIGNTLEQTMTTNGAGLLENDAYDNTTNRIFSEVEMLNILNETRKYCPYTSYCGVDPLLKHLDPRKVSCCRECSCDLDCGLRGDCCHSDLDLYKFKDEMTCVRVKSEYSKLTMSESYYMITKCLAGNTSCTDLGRLHPAYSLSMKRTFYNNQCALCNDIKDVVNWTTFISCHKSPEYFVTPERLAEGMRSGQCGFDFAPPAVMPHKQFACFESLIDRCDTSANAPPYSELTRIACLAVYSPIVSRYVTYANIHCLHCNVKTDIVAEQCLPDNDRTLGTSISILLDYKRLDQIFDDSKSRNSRVNVDKHVCASNFIQHPYKNECRAIHCPFGQYGLYNDCHYVSETWHMWGAVALVLVIKLDNDMPVQDLISTKGAELEKFLRRNRLYWKHTEIIYSGNQATNFTTTNSFLAILVKETENGPINLAHLTNRINKLLDKDFIITFGHRNIKMQLEIDNGIRYRSDRDSVIIITRAVEEDGHAITELFYPLIGQRWTPPFGVFILSIKKLFFCPMVKLRKMEYARYEGSLFIFQNETAAKILFPSEFLVTNGEAFICATDFIISSQVNSSRGHTFKTTICLLLILTFMQNVSTVAF